METVDNTTPQPYGSVTKGYILADDGMWYKIGMLDTPPLGKMAVKLSLVGVVLTIVYVVLSMIVPLVAIISLIIGEILVILGFVLALRTKFLCNQRPLNYPSSYFTITIFALILPTLFTFVTLLFWIVPDQGA